MLIVAPPAIEEGYFETEIGGEMGVGCVEKSRRLAPLYEQTARNNGCYFLDAGAVDGVCMYPYDHMHLSLESHRLLAERLAEMIPEIIG